MQIDKLTQANSFNRSRHFLTLDALRGIAAFSVVILHTGLNWMPSAFLAVDLFFMLSGFVVAYSYEERLLKSMTAWEFMKRRFVRLYPMIIFGSFAALIYPLVRVVIMLRCIIFSPSFVSYIYTP